MILVITINWVRERLQKASQGTLMLTDDPFYVSVTDAGLTA